MKNDYRGLAKYQKGIFKTRDELVELHKLHGRTKIYHVLSFGGGSQSTHLLEEHVNRNIHYDYIIFSDTGAEPQFIHQQLEWWKNRMKEKLKLNTVM